MPNTPDKARRKLLLGELKSKQLQKDFAELPGDRDEVEPLFDMLDRELPSVGCDHTLKLCLRYLNEKSLPVEAWVKWLREHGGFCDCEVLSNVEEHYLRIVAHGK